MKCHSGGLDGSLAKSLNALDLPHPLCVPLALHQLILTLGPLASLHHGLAARAHLMEAAQQALDLRLHRREGQSAADMRSNEAELLIIVF